MTTQLIAQDAVVSIVAVAFLWLYSNYVGNRLQDKVDSSTLTRRVIRFRWASVSWLLLVVLAGVSRQAGWLSITAGYIIGGALLVVGLYGFIALRRQL